MEMKSKTNKIKLNKCMKCSDVIAIHNRRRAALFECVELMYYMKCLRLMVMLCVPNLQNKKCIRIGSYAKLKQRKNKLYEKKTIITVTGIIRVCHWIFGFGCVYFFLRDIFIWKPIRLVCISFVVMVSIRFERWSSWLINSHSRPRTKLVANGAQNVRSGEWLN